MASFAIMQRGVLFFKTESLLTFDALRALLTATIH
jgi:hypothetical protein